MLCQQILTKVLKSKSRAPERNFLFFFLLLLTTALTMAPGQNGPSAAQKPAFYGEVLPILQGHCQVCHRAGGIAPMAFETYEQTRRWAGAIRAAAQNRTMPPWFAERGIGKFSNDPSLSDEQIAVLAAWADANAPAGNPAEAPAKRKWSWRWTMAEPALVVTMTEGVKIPADGDVDYTYEIVPTNFKEGRWVQGVEILPGMRGERASRGGLRAAAGIRSGCGTRRWAYRSRRHADEIENDRRDAMWTDSDILLVYAPGSTPDDWPERMAKSLPAGSDLVFQMHYTTNGHAGTRSDEVGLIFAKQTPAQRVLTLQLTNDHFVIPPGVPDYRVEADGDAAE